MIILFGCLSEVCSCNAIQNARRELSVSGILRRPMCLAYSPLKVNKIKCSGIAEHDSDECSGSAEFNDDTYTTFRHDGVGRPLPTIVRWPITVALITPDHNSSLVASRVATSNISLVY